MAKKLKGTVQVDGRLDDEQIKRLDELVGFNDHGYRNLTAEQYEASLDEMNLIDLHNEAIKRGVMTHERRPIMINNLLRQFKVSTSPYRNYNQEISNWTPAQEKKLKKIMDGK